MPIDVQIPPLGESVSEGVIMRWLKADGDTVQTDEPLLELETDKANVEIPAPAAGVLKILHQEGETARIGDIVARIDASAVGNRAVTASAEAPDASSSAPVAVKDAAKEQTAKPTTPNLAPLSPAVRKLVEEHELAPETIPASGRDGRLTKGDVLAYLETTQQAQGTKEVQASKAAPTPAVISEGEERRVPMTRIRQRIAERLVEAQRTAAILTTFNEVDMSAVLEIRNRFKERFAERHGARLGFISFFARAVIAAIAETPVVNAQIDGAEIVYRESVHLGIAVGTDRGLVVPVVHAADRLAFADLERELERLATLARQNKLGIDDLSGGTFTISNGGVYGSLLSTPILNPPQSAILGMHKIEKRPIAIDDQVVIRPMMYLALSYDHRLIDGAQAVTFLVRVKERIEDPTRLLLDV